MFPSAPELPFPSIVAMADEYLDIVVGLKTATGSSAIKAHLFRLCRPALEIHKDLRESLGKSRFDDKAHGEGRIATYREFVKELGRRLEADMKDDRYAKASDQPLVGSVSHLTPPDPEKEDKHRPSYIPHWLAQPYFRPPLIEGGKEAEKNKASKAVEVKDIQTEAEEKMVKEGRARAESGEREMEGHEEKRARIGAL